MPSLLVQTILANAHQEAGNYQLNLARKDWQAGMYYLNLITDTERLVTKVLMMK